MDMSDNAVIRTSVQIHQSRKIENQLFKLRLNL